MKISEITHVLEQWAPPALQEGYDNCGLLTGMYEWDCTGALCCLDATEEVVREARANNCNLVIAHHPIIFGGLKKINGYRYMERAVIAAIKNDVAIYAIHTNLDSVITGVNARMADRLGLTNRRILKPAHGSLKKLYTFVPHAQVEQVRMALFAAGAGNIGNYSGCSFSVEGSGTFTGNADTQPFVGEPGKPHVEPETKLEVIFPAWQQSRIVSALWKAHPYEEVAFDIISLDNTFAQTGAGMVGELPEPLPETGFLELLKTAFGLKMLRHTPFTGKPVQQVAICGGAGSFLVSNALRENVQAYVTADMKYHEFFDAEGRMIIADIGHWESEQFTTDLIFDYLTAKFPTFAVRKTGIVTNPVQYF